MPVPRMFSPTTAPLQFDTKGHENVRSHATREVPSASTTSRGASYRAGGTSMVTVFQADNFLGHFRAHSIHFWTQHLNIVRGDLVFIGHAVLPPLIGSSASLCTAIPKRSSSWVITASLSSSCTISVHFLKYHLLILHLCLKLVILLSTESEIPLTMPVHIAIIGIIPLCMPPVTLCGIL